MTFQPSTELYGLETFHVDQGGRKKPIGKLEKIISQHCFVVDGVQWEVDASYDFHVEDGKIYLICAWSE